MLTAKEGVLDRIEQSFWLFKDNFIAFFLPMFLFQLFTVILFGAVVTTFVIVSILWILNSSVDVFTFLYSPTMIIMIAIGMIGLILYLILYIPFLTWLVRSIKQACNGEEVTYKENIWTWFKNLWWAFKTYWFIFSYIALLPAILFIISWLLVISTFYFPVWEGVRVLWFIWWFLSVLLFIFFSIYRWIRATFSLFSAVVKEEYTNENFNHSLDITQNNWFRIVGNLLLVWIIIWLITSLISWLISWMWSWWLMESFNISDPKNISLDQIKAGLTNYLDDFSVTASILTSLFNQIINLISWVFVIVFSVVLFMRLEAEYNPSQKVENMSEENVKENMKW